MPVTANDPWNHDERRDGTRTPSERERERLALAIADGESIDWQAIAAAGILSREEIHGLQELEALRIEHPEALESLPPGTVVGDFRLVERIGEGGMGQVWEAEQISLSRRVALKFVRPDRVSEHQLELFAREARASGRMNHPGIVTVHGHGRSAGLAWIAMELVRGARNLRGFLDEVTRAEQLPRDHDQRVARYAAEIAEAMQAAHAAGVIHRDLKPQNVLLTPEDRIKITDFGVARITDEQALSHSGERAGTYLYMSPEQLAGKRSELDHRTDVFSLGVVLYELLTLRRPFEGDTSHQVAEQILAKDPADPRTIRSRVPRDLAVIAGKALEKDRGKRFQTIGELALDLRRYLAGEPIHARPPTLAHRLVKWVRRNPGRSSAGAIASVAVVVISLLLADNLHANRGLRDAVAALGAKTSEAERSAQAASEQAALATARADDVLRLSALQDLDDLVSATDGFWPARPERIRAFELWIQDARALVADLPLHRAKRDELRAASAREGPTARAGSATPAEQHIGLAGHPGEPRDRTIPEEEREARWWINQLTKLIEGLEGLERGLLSPDGTTEANGWSIPKRLSFARALESGFAAGGPYAQAWSDALPAIHAAHPGLALTPQIGLVPIGADPRSGLWEFAHLETGEPAVRGADGKLALSEATGLVLVLLPGGTFRRGAQRTDPEGPNYDPQAQQDESPVHEVTLSPFFLSKYEMTQAQWSRFAGRNPSVYQTEKVAPELHPVEQVTWTACHRLCAQMALVLPTGAQWEYAARGGTSTVWWTGNERESLRGAVNLADQAAAREGVVWPEIKDWPDLDDGYASHAPVYEYVPNPFGFHSMSGNVYEWCLDGHKGDPYPSEPVEDPCIDPTGLNMREYRGGSFYGGAMYTRSGNRSRCAPDFTSSEHGLRPARAVLP